MSEKPVSVFEQLDKGINPGTGTVAPPAAALDSGTVNLLSQFLTLMAARETRELAKEQAAIDQQKTREKQREKNAKEQDVKVIARQARCKHKKGGSSGPKNSNVDYAIGVHTFPSAETVIKCLICGVKWRQGDTDEYFLRIDKNGNQRKISNHTHIGWRKAVEMFQQSTNTKTSSEILHEVVRPGFAPVEGGYRDAAGLPVVNQVVDMEGKPVADFEL
jgi:hypothetical protein